MNQEHLDPISRLTLHVFRAQQCLSNSGDRLTAPWGMTSAKWKVLGAVELSDQAPSASGIARIMGLTRQAATKQIHMLVDQGLLTPREDPLDARAPVYSLSRKGKATYASISAAWAERVKILNASMDASAITTALAVLDQLVIQLEQTPTAQALQFSGPRKRKGSKK